LTDVAELLAVSPAQAYALVRCGDLPAVKIGGRGQWRIEAQALETYITRLYDETAAFIADHPYGRGEPEATAAPHRPHTEPPRMHSTVE
jgi:excisionase family DNA binding protein